MSDPWDTMPEGLDGRVEAYLKKAAKLAITPDLVKKYALIVVAAEEVLLHRDEMLRATREEAIQVAALEHGIDEPDPKKARKAYSAARQGHQTIHTSAKSCAKNVSRFEIVLTRRYKSLQVDVAGRFPLNDLVAACKLIRDFAEATKPHPHDLGKVKFAKSPLSLTAAGHTFVWWRKVANQYRGL